MLKTSRATGMTAVVSLVLVSLYLPTWVTSYPSSPCADYFRLQDRCDVAYGTAINTSYSVSLRACLHRCQRDPGCYSATFDDRNKACTTNSGQTTRFSDECDFKLKYAAVVKSNCKDVLHEDCLEHGECSFEHGRCRSVSDTCECGSKYRYNPATVNCVLDCETYGSTFETHEQYALAHPDKWAERKLSLDEAKAECLYGDDQFVCLAFAYYPDNNASFSQSAQPLRTKISSTDMYYRNCVIGIVRLKPYNTGKTTTPTTTTTLPTTTTTTPTTTTTTHTTTTTTPTTTTATPTTTTTAPSTTTTAPSTTTTPITTTTTPTTTTTTPPTTTTTPTTTSATTTTSVIPPTTPPNTMLPSRLAFPQLQSCISYKQTQIDVTISFASVLETIIGVNGNMACSLMCSSHGSCGSFAYNAG